MFSFFAVYSIMFKIVIVEIFASFVLLLIYFKEVFNIYLKKIVCIILVFFKELCVKSKCSIFSSFL